MAQRQTADKGGRRRQRGGGYAAVDQFAKDMDVAAVDMRSTEAWHGGKDLQNAIKSDGSVKNSKTSAPSRKRWSKNQWKHMADDLRKTGGDGALPKAESWSEESIRQEPSNLKTKWWGRSMPSIPC